MSGGGVPTAESLLVEKAPSVPEVGSSNAGIAGLTARPRLLPPWASNRAMPWAACAAGYVAASTILWWHVVSDPARRITCLCADPGQTLWYLKWAEFALVHGQNPLFTRLLQAPVGVNVLDNTSELLIGVLLTPVTWAAGPVVAFNTAAVLSPVVTSLAGAAVCRRFCGWPASFVGGLLFGFSSLVVGNLPFGHLNATTLALPALQFLCLHELLVRQGRSPVRWGALLGVLVIAQFFVSTEMLVASVFIAALVLTGTVVASAAHDRRALRARLPHAARGIGVAVAVSVVGLAYPAWFAEAGPQHFSGLVWPTVAEAGNRWTDFFSLGAVANQPTAFGRVGGYSGDAGPPLAFLGPWLLAASAVSAALGRKVRVVWLGLIVAAAAGVLSLGASAVAAAGARWWLPWRLMAHVPLVQNVLPNRMVAFTDLFVALIVAVGMDRLWTYGSSTRRTAGRRVWRLSAGALATAAVLPLAASFSSAPYVVSSVSEPAWFTAVAPHLRGNPVLLVLPDASSRFGDAMAWQALSGMHFTMVGSYGKTPGPSGAVVSDGQPGNVSTALSRLSAQVATAPEPSATLALLESIRQALRAAKVSAIVIAASTMRDPSYAAGFLTAVLGSTPVIQDDAWVWTHPFAARGPLSIPADTVQRCRVREGAVVDTLVPRCVLAAARRGP